MTIVDALLKMIDVNLEPLLKQAEALETQIKTSVDAAMEAQQSRTPKAPIGASPGMYY